MPRYCRGCCRFVSGALARCRSCGHEHDRDNPALEEPVPFRRKGQLARRRRNRFAL